MSAPTNWSELLASDVVARRRGDVRSAAQLVPRMAQLGSPVLAVGSVAPELCAVAVADGPGAVRPVLEALRAVLERALARAHPDASDPLPALGLLGVLAVAEGGGLEGLAPEAVRPGALLGAAARGRTGLSEQELHRAAFAAVGCGEGALVPALLGHPREGGDFTPGRTFGFNAVGFLEYLAHAQEVGAPEEAVRPGLEAFVAAFPRKLGAGTLEWTDLLWAARAVRVLGRRPAAGALEELHAHVRALA